MRVSMVAVGAGAVVLAGMVGAYLRANAATVDNAAPEDAPSAEAAADPGGWTDAAASAADAVNPFAIMESNTVAQDQADANCIAFLGVISESEGTARAADPYAVCYGYRHTVQSFADHPAVTGEWRGESIANLGPSYAGKVSTAAGAFQIIKPTWLAAKRALALPDFSPDSQDKAALWIVRNAGALDDVKAGRFDAAVAKCASQWASLPGANAPGQAMRKLGDLRTAFVQSGGALA